MKALRTWLTAALLGAASVACGADDDREPTAALDAGDAAQDGTPDDAEAEPRLPCSVETVLQNRCQGCHAAPPRNGAPFSLMTFADTQADYAGEPVYERMGVAIATDFMPPDPRPKLTGAEREAMLDWIADGAGPAGPGEACP